LKSAVKLPAAPNAGLQLAAINAAQMNSHKWSGPKSHGFLCS
jgi:hypothetical protein